MPGPGPVLTAFETLVSDRGDHPAIFALSEGRILTFRDLAEECRHAELTLTRAKVERGSCVLAALGNQTSWFSIFLACAARGDTLLSTDAETTPEELRRLASLYGAAVAVVPSSNAGLHSATSNSIEPTPAGRWSLLPLDTKNRELRTYEDALVLKLTSGSSGEPKAVHVTEDNLFNDARHIVEAMGIASEDVNYGVIPISHSYGLGNLVAPLLVQGTAIALRELFLPRQMDEDIEAHDVSVLPGVPFLFRQILERHEPSPLPDSLRLLISAGASIGSTLVSEFKSQLGQKIHSFYGSSETGGITYDDDDELTEPLNVGRPLPETEVLLESDDVSTKQGRVLIRGNAVSRGYVNGAHERDVARFIDGGFASGDLGRFDDDGRLYLTGRLSSFVNVAGRKVDPSETERALLSMPDVAEAKVMGMPCELRGEKLVAFVVPTSPPLEPMRIRSYCATKLAPHKIPRDVVVLGAMPLTPRGKIDRRALEALSSTGRPVPDRHGS